MTELKVTSKKYNDKDVLEVENFNAEVKPIVDQAIQADKDIISQIEMTYDEENDCTDIIFPKGVMPLSITINTHELFIKEGVLVNYIGEEVEGYELDDYYLEDDNVILHMVGDLSEQVINGLSYISFNGIYWLIYNTYNLFFPQPSGTKLYEHHLIGTYEFILINNSPTPIDFSTYDTYEKIYNLIKDSIVKFYNPTNLSSTLYDENSNPKCFYACGYDSDTDSIVYSSYDDWDLSETIDTVTEL